MTYFVMSDTHFNHPNIIAKFGKRPRNYEDRITKGLMRLRQSDILIHLGDICMYNSFKAHSNIIRKIKSKKILVRGNHDKKSYDWYLHNGWDFVCDSFTKRLLGMNVLFSHKPVVPLFDDFSINTREMAELSFDLNIHGHLHNCHPHWGEALYSDKKVNISPMHYNLSMEELGYQPLSLDSILNRVKKGKDNE